MHHLKERYEYLVRTWETLTLPCSSDISTANTTGSSNKKAAETIIKSARVTEGTEEGRGPQSKACRRWIRDRIEH
jgi:hypothetical protein